MDANALEIGRKYWILQQSNILLRTVPEEHEDGNVYLDYSTVYKNGLIHCVLKKIHENIYDTEIIDQNIVNSIIYHFYSDDCDSKLYKVSLTEIENYVFKEKDDYLVLLFQADMMWKKRDTKIRIKYSDYIKKKIKESQHIHPEKWIF